MSSSTGDNGALVATFSGLLVSNYCTVSTTALFIYECAITLGDEANLFWRRPLTGATALFVSNRLAAMIYLVYALITSYIPLSTQVSCSNNIIASKVIEILQYFPWAAFSAMRGLALTRNWQLATFVFLLSVVPVAVNLAAFSFNVSGEVVPYIGCSSSDSLTVDMIRRFWSSCQGLP
ncbi:hypothetical protein OH76DRAFT_306890 [Lentinus brumalis]|uniref:DUF6533 domain-containing protein n=1 Tax=Lentinus brumalis TaxID=2498619 RepID=A0A371CKD2_9APHY|nr:hypothetical protein OH76DRAFT_306890 [Polyporus brumalis]